MYPCALVSEKDWIILFYVEGAVNGMMPLFQLKHQIMYVFSDFYVGVLGALQQWRMFTIHFLLGMYDGYFLWLVCYKFDLCTEDCSGTACLSMRRSCRSQKFGHSYN